MIGESQSRYSPSTCSHRFGGGGGAREAMLAGRREGEIS